MRFKFDFLSTQLNILTLFSIELEMGQSFILFWSRVFFLLLLPFTLLILTPSIPSLPRCFIQHKGSQLHWVNKNGLLQHDDSQVSVRKKIEKGKKRRRRRRKKFRISTLLFSLALLACQPALQTRARAYTHALPYPIVLPINFQGSLIVYLSLFQIEFSITLDYMRDKKKSDEGFFFNCSFRLHLTSNRLLRCK